MTEENNTEKAEREEDFADREGDLDDPLARLQEVIQERDQERQNYLRALADLENYKKRATKERSELLKYQGENIIIDLLEVLDNLDLALEQDHGEAAKIQEGIEMIHKMFLEVLNKWGVQVNAGLGQAFNPEIHEALSMVPSEEPAGTILQELKKAYHYNGKLIRPGQVVVAEHPKESEK